MGKRDNNDLSAANTTASVQVLPMGLAEPVAAAAAVLPALPLVCVCLHAL